MLENNVILQRCHNIATMLQNMLDHNVATTFRQHCVNTVWMLVPNVKFRPNDNVQATLCEPWCQTLKSDQTTTFRQPCHNSVATLKNNFRFQCCYNVVPKLRNYVIFNFATMLVQHCRNSLRITNLISHFGIKFKMFKSIHFNW